MLSWFVSNLIPAHQQQLYNCSLLYYEKEENMGAQIEILQKIKRFTEQKRIYVYKAEVRHVYHVANFGFCRILSTNPDGVKSHQNIWLPYIAQYP